MRDVHAHLTTWMTQVGMSVRVDAVGNLRGAYAAAAPASATLYIGSHLDTVRRAGAFDGVLGVVLGIELVGRLGRRALAFGIEVVGFSEEEGVRFGVPFIGSRALAGTADADLLERRDGSGRSVREAIADFGLNPAEVPVAKASTERAAYLEFHIEQGPVLERLGLPVGMVDVISGQSRVDLTFDGASSHAGTTPMADRRDALAGAAEWIAAVERHALVSPGLVATVGRIDAQPGSTNVIAGRCIASLDVRHADDAARTAAVDALVLLARESAGRRGLSMAARTHLDQPAVPMDRELVERLAHAVELCGLPRHVLASGAGHDAMILAGCMPAAMLFLRSPGGISHHPDESVLVDDVAAALEVGERFLHDLTWPVG